MSPAISTAQERIVGELTSFRAAGADGWGIGELHLDADRMKPPVTITGKLVGVRLGDLVEAHGSWSEHPKYGRQFKVRRCSSQRPASPAGIVAWLVSTLPDIGATRAKAMVERFGQDLWTVIEFSPQRLSEIPGVTSERAHAIQAAYFEHRADRDHMIRLRGWELTDRQIARCLARWKTLRAVIDNITANPYRLAEAVHGFGFVRADKVAMLAGVPYDSPHRVDAALEHVLALAIGSEGHVFLWQGELRKRTFKLTGVDEDLVQAGIGRALRAGALVRRGTRIYLARLEAAESGWAGFVEEMLA